MSGSGGGGWANEPSVDRCETLRETTTLNSPQKVVIASLKAGDLLEVTLTKQGKAPVVIALHQGQVAGTITSSIVQKLAECIDGGHNYVAEVIGLQGGACKVQIRAK